jgi:hypothetical protein
MEWDSYFILWTVLIALKMITNFSSTMDSFEQALDIVLGKHQDFPHRRDARIGGLLLLIFLCPFLFILDIKYFFINARIWTLSVFYKIKKKKQ